MEDLNEQFPAPENEVQKNKRRIRWMTTTGILTAIIILMSFTPLGYLRVGPVDITFIMIPVVVGAILVGPASGAFLGAIFGLTSFIQCFGMSPFGATLLAIDPFLTFVLCMVPRVLMGWLVGLIFKGLFKIDRTNWISFIIASLSGALINTVLFVGGLILFFGNSDYIQSFGPNLMAILGVLITLNVALEATVCTVVGTAVTKPLYRIIKR